MRRAAFAIVLFAFGCSEDPATPPPPDPSFCELVADGTECDDGNPCTLVDVCRSGACTGSDLMRCDAPGQCQQAGTCDPNTGACVNPPKRDGSACDDGDLCTQVDECRGGVCVGDAPVVCRRLDECRVAGECDPSTGLCSHPFAPDDTACEDGNPCTENDVCVQGVCTSGAPAVCAEADECGSAGVCDPATGDCLRQLEPDGTPCEDGDLCSVGDSCRDGVCRAGAPRVCEATDPCHVVTGCAPDTGCLVTNHADGAPCNDANRCTADDHCVAGTCTSTTTVVCTALDACHDPGVCDPTTGCSDPPKPDGTFCEDNDLCTLVSSCIGGVCTSSIAVVCPPSNETCVMNGQCEAATGECVFPPEPNGTACNDGSSCTSGDVCTAGTCEGTPIPTGVQPCSSGLCFTAVTATVGITFTSTPSIYMGAGAAFADVAGDGRLDVVLSSETVGVRVYENRGASFVDVTTAIGIAPFLATDRVMGFAAADYDNDGDTDLYVVVRGANRLYRNDGTTLTDVTAIAGVGDTQWSTGAAFGDYDNDGDLDLYVGNYVAVGNFPFHTPFPNTLYENDGDGTFTDVTALRGVAGAGTTLAVTWTDYDADGDVDLFVCNDFGAFVEPNRLYRNNGGSFTEVSAAVGFDVGIFCMGIAASDYDGDRDLDYYFTNLGRNVFLENRGAAGFVDVTVPTGTGVTTDVCRAPLLATSWGTGFFDFDADGVEELYVSNGYVPAEASIANAFDTPNSLFVMGSPFVEVGESARIDDRRIGRGVAFGDYDDDGDVDILQANVDGPAILLRNDAPASGAFLVVSLEGRRSNRDGFGARLEARFGTQFQVREANANFSYQSSSDPRIHFGAGLATQADHLTIAWPSGVVQDLFDVPTGMTVAALEPIVTATITGAAPTPVARSSTLVVSAQLTNSSTTAVTVAYTLDVGAAQTSGSVVVGAQSSSTIAPSVTVPAGTPVGPTPATLTVTESGAIDQARIVVSVTAG